MEMQGKRDFLIGGDQKKGPIQLLAIFERNEITSIGFLAFDRKPLALRMQQSRARSVQICSFESRKTDDLEKKKGQLYVTLQDAIFIQSSSNQNQNDRYPFRFRTLFDF